MFSLNRSSRSMFSPVGRDDQVLLHGSRGRRLPVRRLLLVQRPNIRHDESADDIASWTHSRPGCGVVEVDRHPSPGLSTRNILKLAGIKS